jgi:hypothetical protein
METIALIIENAKDGTLWGRVSFDDNLITEEAVSVPELESKMKVLLKEWHKVDPDSIVFERQYDIASLFEENKFLNAAVIAERAGINKSLMRQYAAGIKFPSVERVKQIEDVIHELGRELIKVKISGKSSRYSL